MLAPPAVRVPSARADFVQHHADGTVIIDTQSADDYAADHIPGTRNRFCCTCVGRAAKKFHSAHRMGRAAFAVRLSVLTVTMLWQDAWCVLYLP